MDDVKKAVRGLKDELTNFGKFIKNLELGDIGKLGEGMKATASAFVSISKQEAGIKNAAQAVRQLAIATNQLVRAQSGLQNFNAILGSPGKGLAGSSVTGSHTSSSGNANRLPTQQTLFAIPGKPPFRGGNPPGQQKPQPWKYLQAPNLPLFIPQGNKLVPNPSAMVLPPQIHNPGYGSKWTPPTTPAPQSYYHLGPKIFDGKIGDFFGGIHSSGMWLMRHGIAGAGLYGGLSAIGTAGGIVGGTPQEQQLTARKQLHAAGATRADRAYLELEAMKLNQKYPFTKLPNVSELQSEFGTYFPISEIGPAAVAKMTEYGAVMQEIGQVKDPRLVADVLAGPVRVKLNRMSEAERKSKLSPGNDWVQKQVARNYGIMSKADEIFPMQAKDMAEFFKHALVMTERSGMPIEEALVDLGMARQGAMRASTSGRGQRTVLPKLPEWIAKMMILADPQTKKLKEGEQKAVRKKLEERIRRETDQDPNSLYNLYSKVYTDAQQYHIKPAETIGMDKEWLPLMELKSTEEQLKLRQEKIDQLRQAGEDPDPLRDSRGYLKVGDLYTNFTEVANAANQAKVGLSNLASSTGLAQTAFSTLSGLFNKIGQDAQAKATGIQYANQVNNKVEYDDNGMPIYTPQYDLDRLKTFQKIDKDNVEAQYRFLKETDVPKNRPEQFVKPIRNFLNWLVDSMVDLDVATSSMHGEAMNFGGAIVKKGGGFKTTSEYIEELDDERKRQFVAEWKAQQPDADSGAKELKGSANDLSVAAQLLSQAAQALNIVTSNNYSPLMRDRTSPSLFSGNLTR
jgi:hypothetical protein